MELLEGEQEFLDLVSTMADLMHPNICILQGYCMDPGHHALLYDYAQNGSLYSALFSKNGDSQKPLSWKLRLRIALGVAHALEYVLFNYSFSDKFTFQDALPDEPDFFFIFLLQVHA